MQYILDALRFAPVCHTSKGELTSADDDGIQVKITVGLHLDYSKSISPSSRTVAEIVRISAAKNRTAYCHPFLFNIVW